jgi:hypothetical protein
MPQAPPARLGPDLGLAVLGDGGEVGADVEHDVRAGFGAEDVVGAVGVLPYRGADTAESLTVTAAPTLVASTPVTAVSFGPRSDVGACP